MFHGPPPDGGASRRRAMRFTARPRVGGRRAAGRWRLCVLLQKVVCVSLDLTCFYWEVTERCFGGTSEFGKFLLFLSSLCE